jgi:hypothetical protein
MDWQGMTAGEVWGVVVFEDINVLHLEEEKCSPSM